MSLVLTATPSPPPSDVGSIECFTLLPHPLLLSHANPPASCTLLGPLPQVPHPGQQTGSLAPDEDYAYLLICLFINLVAYPLVESFEFRDVSVHFINRHNIYQQNRHVNVHALSMNYELI